MSHPPEDDIDPVAREKLQRMAKREGLAADAAPVGREPAVPAAAISPAVVSSGVAASDQTHRPRFLDTQEHSLAEKIFRGERSPLPRKPPPAAGGDVAEGADSKTLGGTQKLQTVGQPPASRPNEAFAEREDCLHPPETALGEDRPLVPAGIPTDDRVGIRKQRHRLGGAIVLALCAVGFIALATWIVADGETAEVVGDPSAPAARPPPKEVSTPPTADLPTAPGGPTAATSSPQPPPTSTPGASAGPDASPPPKSSPIAPPAKSPPPKAPPPHHPPAAPSTAAPTPPPSPSASPPPSSSSLFKPVQD